jgi:hypothetical protein
VRSLFFGFHFVAIKIESWLDSFYFIIDL